MKRQNIILITIDSLRADHLGFMGYQKNISPNIDRLADESVVFTNAFANGPVTPHSFPSSLTSTYPLDYQGPRKIDRPRVLISEVLKRYGFITAAFHSNAYLSSFFGYNRGWDYFEDIIPDYDLLLSFGRKSFKREIFKKWLLFLAKISFSFSPEMTFRIRYLFYKFGLLRTTPKSVASASYINQITEDFISSIKNENRPFFCWIHYMDVHLPYFPYDCYFKDRKLSYRELVSKELPGFLSEKYFFEGPFKKFSQKYLKETIDFYDQGIKYVDEQIGELIRFLREANIYQDTIVFLTADHGDEFLEHGGSSHSSKLYNEILRVPLLIKDEKLTPRVINKKVSLIDLSPTICSLVGVKKDPAFKGENLLDEKENVIFHQTGVNRKQGWNASLTEIEHLNQCKIACQDEKWKYIIDYSNRQEELYNLIEDPQEKNNLSKAGSKTLSQMRKKIKEFEKENPPLSLLKNYERK